MGVVGLVVLFSLLYLFLFWDSGHWFGVDDCDDEFVDKFLNRVYFSLCTTSTIGFGMVAPRSRLARLLLCVHMATVVGGVAVFVRGM